MLAFGIHFLIGYSIGLIFRNDDVGNSKRKYLVSIIFSFLVLAIYTGNVSSQSAGMYAAASAIGSFSAFNLSLDKAKKLKSKYIHFWLLLLGLILLVTAYVVSMQSGLYKSFMDSVGAKNSNPSWSIAIKPTYDSASFFTDNGLAPVAVKRNGVLAWGFIDSDGNYKIKPQFDFAFPFTDNQNLTAARVGGEKGLWGFIDTSGSFVINPQYDGAFGFSENGLAAVGGTNSDSVGFVGYVRSDGSLAIKEDAYSRRFVFTLPFARNGLAAVISFDSGKYGFINEQGAIVIDFNFDETFMFSSNDLAVVWVGDNETKKCGFIDKNGAFVVTPKYNECFPLFSENGLLAVQSGENEFSKWGYVNSIGEFVINPQYDKVDIFGVNGLAAVRIGDEASGKWGYIDKSGKFVINPQFEDAGRFGRNGLAPVKIQGKWGYISYK